MKTPVEIVVWNGGRDPEAFHIKDANGDLVYRGPCSFNAVNRQDAEVIVKALNAVRQVTDVEEQRSVEGHARCRTGGPEMSYDPNVEADRVRLWHEFAVHGGPQGPFMLYHGFREALKKLHGENAAYAEELAREATDYMHAVAALFAIQPEGDCLAERKPTKDHKAYSAFMYLNDQGKLLRAALAKNPSDSATTLAVETNGVAMTVMSGSVNEGSTPSGSAQNAAPVENSAGWKLVPVEATVPMMRAMGELRALGQWAWKNSEAWKAMLDASPEGNAQSSDSDRSLATTTPTPLTIDVDKNSRRYLWMKANMRIQPMFPLPGEAKPEVKVWFPTSDRRNGRLEWDLLDADRLDAAIDAQMRERNER